MLEDGPEDLEKVGEFRRVSGLGIFLRLLDELVGEAAGKFPVVRDGNGRLAPFPADEVRNAVADQFPAPGRVESFVMAEALRAPGVEHHAGHGEERSGRTERVDPFPALALVRLAVLRFPGDPVGEKPDADMMQAVGSDIADAEEAEVPDLETGLFARLADGAAGEGLPRLEVSADEGPEAGAVRVLAPAHQDLAVLHDHDADADFGTFFVRWHTGEDMTLPLEGQARRAADRLQAALKTDIRYAARGGFWLMLGQASGTLSSFFLAVAFANLIPKEAYGTYKYLLGLAGVVGAFSLSGLATSLTRAVAMGARGVLRPAFRYAFLWNQAIGLLAVAAGGYYAFRGNMTLAGGLFAVGLLLPAADAAGAAASGFLQGLKDFRTGTGYQAALNVSTAASLVAAMLFTESPLALVILVLGLRAGFELAFYRRTSKRDAGADHAVLHPDILPYAKKLTAMNVLSNAAAHLDKIILFQALGPASVGVYAFALAPPEQLKSLPKMLHALVLPRFSERSESEVRKTLGKKMALVALVLVPLAGLYALAAPFLFRLLFPAYLESVPYSQVLALIIPLSGLAVVPSALLAASMAVREKLVLTTVTPALRIVLMLALVTPFGAWGVVWAVLLASALNGILAVTLALRRSVPLPETEK